MKIACLIDSKHKVQHNRVKALQFLFPNSQFYPIIATKGALKGKLYDVIYYCSFALFPKCPIKHPAIRASITSHKSIDDIKKTRKILKNIHRISVNNKLLYKYFRAKNVCYIPNGVDTSFFSPAEEKRYDPNSIKFGWVGNSDRSTKNFWIVKKLAGMRDFQFRVLATSKSKPLKKTRKQMVDFYRSIDFLLVTSSTEGTPNPALEAAACGVPIISSPVGNVPDLVENGASGFIVDSPSPAAFREVMSREIANITMPEYHDMSQKIRDSAVREWRWEDRRKLFKDFLLK